LTGDTKWCAYARVGTGSRICDTEDGVLRGEKIQGSTSDHHTADIPLESEFSRECGNGLGTAQPPVRQKVTRKPPANNCDIVLINDSFNDDYMSI